MSAADKKKGALTFRDLVKTIEQWRRGLSSLEVGAVRAIFLGSKDRIGGQLWQLVERM